MAGGTPHGPRAGARTPCRERCRCASCSPTAAKSRGSCRCDEAALQSERRRHHRRHAHRGHGGGDGSLTSAAAGSRTPAADDVARLRTGGLALTSCSTLSLLGGSGHELSILCLLLSWLRLYIPGRRGVLGLRR